ncbi:ribosome-associated ATPase/putative transporter RbbA [Hyphomicrobium sp.]|uniref:ribosome-associated ATPase/putative transporter RbbA n=1 Tax=Hyphomicrobium sp. TaxID=82 RepID=UPI002E33C1D5|nr:ribosome-associated ATPase/putative transporter RbbA [Hyphomicrobium sp.]HEX2842073.1 ribosome-associated ATPase/putative transporter RbbA [Hyphomicrobium sp.]
MNDAVASLVSVTHRYGERMALRDVTVYIPSGRTTGLVGPDGVGKSSLLALVAGVRRIQDGTVTALDGDMRSARHRRSAYPRIAYMPQGLGRNLYPTLSVAENIDFFGRLFGQGEAERRQRIEELARSTGLEPFLDRPAGKLSGGMKQKLSLCCALVHDPELLILDEPTTGVDPLARRQFWKLIGRIRERNAGMSVVTATAYMEEAAEFDHLIAMDAGAILAEGSSPEILARTGSASLEDAFVALLPDARRNDTTKIIVPPRQAGAAAAAIEAQNLTLKFGDFVAVDDVSLRIERGEIFGFLGSNGCGKTTTMKILTGLLQATSGTARLFGQPADAADLETRKRVGYMSQSFSLYGELTVRQNLILHARLFHLRPNAIEPRVAEILKRYDLDDVADALPDALPLGVRQRLQLATAVLHKPEVLILDEPTSGVDPIARDRFWEQLVRLSREENVTIFLSTHFVNEAERCDRVSLMHAGRLLAIDTPAAIASAHQGSLEEAFIALIEKAQAGDSVVSDSTAQSPPDEVPSPDPSIRAPKSRLHEVGKLWAFTRREALELIRDPIRIAFALVGPLILAVAMAYGISFDIENVEYAVLDGDQSLESRTLLQAFSGSRYFEEQPPLQSQDEIESRLKSGKLRVALMIPPNFGRDLLRGRQPELGVVLDGANTFRAETTRGYVQGVLSAYVSDLARREGLDVASLSPMSIETRFRYNQAFLSLNAISPGVLMLLLIMFSTMLTALGIVREKELGSITNLYAAPVSKFAFLVGKQLPYVALGLFSFILLVLLITLGFGVPISGSFFALALGALLYCLAATALGLVVSSFVRSQIAAIFGSAILVMIPTVNFSGMMYPVSTLEGGARVIGQLFPALYFQRISSGVFSKAQDIGALYPNHLALAAFCVLFLGAAALLLKRQET